MYMPVVAASRLKCDIGEKYGTLLRIRQRIQIGISDKILCESGIFLTETEYILTVKFFSVIDFHKNILSYYTLYRTYPENFFHRLQYSLHGGKDKMLMIHAFQYAQRMEMLSVILQKMKKEPATQPALSLFR